MKRRSHLRALVALVLCLAMTLSLSVSALAAFQDVPEGSELAEAVAVLEENGITVGVEAQRFHPDANLTAAQLCIFLGRIAGITPDQSNVPEGVEADGWSGGYIAWAYEQGLLGETIPAKHDPMTAEQVNAALAVCCAAAGVEAVTVTAAAEFVTRGEAALALAQLVSTGDEVTGLESATYTTVTEGFDWGPAVNKVILDLGVEIDPASVAAENFSVTSLRTFPEMNYDYWYLMEPSTNAEARPVLNAYVSDAVGVKAESGTHVALELAVAPYMEGGSPFWFDLITNVNRYVDEMAHEIVTTAPLKAVDGSEVNLTRATALTYDEENSVTLLADDFDTTGKYTYTYDNGEREIGLSYASWFPKENAADASTPLIIWLHGQGEGGTDPNVAILGNKVVNLITEDVQKNFGETGAAVLAPQSPTMWLDTSGTFNMAMGTDNSESFYTEALMSLIVDFVKEHPEIDAKRIYIGGCSNGGYMTINMLVNYPGAFAAAYPVCEPYANDWMTEEKLATLVDTPIWLTAAKSDTIVTLYEGYWDEEPPYLYHVTKNEAGEEVAYDEYSNALYRRLTEAGAKNVHYSLFDKVLDTTGNYVNEAGEPYEYDGHWSWIYTLNNECTETIDGKETSLFAWMAQQKGEGKLPQLPLEKKVYENPITFYLVRHGETEYNTQHLMQGHCDSALTENGVNLAKKLGEGLADVDFAAAYTSDSGRAVATTENILGDRQVPVTQDENLREMFFGEVEGLPQSEVYTSEEVMGYCFNVGFDIFGGETWDDLMARVHTALENAAYAHREEGGNILISTHGMSILAALYATVPEAEGVMDQGEIDNCSVTILEWDNGVYTLKALNDSSYLG